MIWDSPPGHHLPVCLLRLLWMDHFSDVPVFDDLDSLESTVRCFEDCRSVGIYMMLFSGLDGFVGFGRMTREIKCHVHHNTSHHITSRVQTSNMNITADANIDQLAHSGLHACPLQSHFFLLDTLLSLDGRHRAHLPGSSGGTLRSRRAGQGLFPGWQDCVFLVLFSWDFLIRFYFQLFVVSV